MIINNARPAFARRGQKKEEKIVQTEYLLKKKRKPPDGDRRTDVLTPVYRLESYD
jgi:hypothetical protein